MLLCPDELWQSAGGVAQLPGPSADVNAAMVQVNASLCLSFSTETPGESTTQPDARCTQILPRCSINVSAVEKAASNWDKITYSNV